MAQISRREAQEYERELCQRNFVDFIQFAWPQIDTAPFRANWHIKVLADHLQAMLDGAAEPRLLINICPGSAKSMIVNVMFPAWVWTRDPSKRIISASHKEKLAIRDSVKSRRLIQSEWYQRHWPTQLQGDQNAKAAFENLSGGAREAMPFTSMTGSRGNIVIIDDPLSVDDAKSPAYRDSVKETFLEAVPSRLNNPDTDLIIVVMQRLHEEDISGVILDKPDLGYDHLCIPLFADGEVRKPTSFGWTDHREEGENMFPARYTDRVVKGYKSSLGPFAFAGQYQQRPVPANDGFFLAEWFEDRYKLKTADYPGTLPKHLHYYMTSDHAPSGNGDYNVFRIWGVDTTKQLWLVDSFRKKCIMDEAMGIVRDSSGKTTIAETGALALIQKYSPMCWYPENDNTWIAIKGFVHSAMVETQTFCRIQELPTKGSGDKMGKAVAYQAMASMKRIHLPEGPIGDEALKEYATFPNGKHDDQVDADGAIARALADAMPAFAPEPVVHKVRDEYEQRYVGNDSDSCW
ncbi:hypothetical protein C8J25_107280 [Sphingomonas faeni]|uniref:Phage terminase large subunit-like protein n=1 Tax=Sphingomonas faeni TaxID=185950 RepID=A0A2T5U254_9SPHN|nr:hypothetical protein [Sphingomonas faeni]PTW45595.1 hypothetical protein C8J25_107280 [Sphingomonas faeni]